MDSNLHFQDRQLIELSLENADPDALIDRASQVLAIDEPCRRRLDGRCPGARRAMAAEGVLEQRRSQKSTAALGLQPAMPGSDRLLALPGERQRNRNKLSTDRPA